MSIRGGRARLARGGGLAQTGVHGHWVGRGRHAHCAARKHIREGALGGVVVDRWAPLCSPLRAHCTWRDGRRGRLVLLLEMLVGGSEQVVVGDGGSHGLDLYVEGLVQRGQKGRGECMQRSHILVAVETCGKTRGGDGKNERDVGASCFFYSLSRRSRQPSFSGNQTLSPENFSPPALSPLSLRPHRVSARRKAFQKIFSVEFISQIAEDSPLSRGGFVPRGMLVRGRHLGERI
ncbi:hypothetical protein SCHPADRAFT_570870 [Schizopora paradoxa]|uniref:Uncharacterized protein n=1 Tax=Schizopora paradoxa TaxID=27342 RepID=A0A0H2RWY2_9AGAM|nr:hypothetical protein SCHPADRAFT_570870 [Schizopora paradoxa]